MRNIDKTKMANNYKIMGEINLSICGDFFLLENEGEKLNEMDFKKRKSKA